MIKTKYQGQQLKEKFLQHKKRVKHLLHNEAPVDHHGIVINNNYDKTWHNLSTAGMLHDQVLGESDEDDEVEVPMVEEPVGTAWQL